MSAYICEICEGLKDSDYNVCTEYKDGLICEGCVEELEQENELEQNYSSGEGDAS